MLLAVIEAARVGGWSSLYARIQDRRGFYTRFLVHFGYAIDDNQPRWLGLAMEIEGQGRYAEAGKEEMLELALQASDLGVWEWNMITDEMTWDERHSDIFGLRHEAGPWTFEYFLGFVHQDDRRMLLEKINHALSHADRWQAECRVIRANGNQCWISIHGMVTNGFRRQGLRMVGSIYDISGRKRREQQWEEIISIAGHELRTPITSIKGYSQLLLNQLTDDAGSEEVRIVDRLVSQADRLSGLVRNLLDTTRFTDRELVLNYQWFDLDELAGHCIEAVKVADLQRPVLFQDKQAGQIYADQDRIRQVCLNLLSNAFKYSGSGSPVTVRTWRDQGMAGFSVSDQGIGIPQEMKERIFDKFVQVDQRTPAGGSGLGLGLYISAGIIRSHGGLIGVESTLGQGSRFYFTLPAELR